LPANRVGDRPRSRRLPQAVNFPGSLRHPDCSMDPHEFAALPAYLVRHEHINELRNRDSHSHAHQGCRASDYAPCAAV
jgi:hypothetical protein